jgi:hypothetical protein
VRAGSGCVPFLFGVPNEEFLPKRITVIDYQNQELPASGVWRGMASLRSVKGETRFKGRVGNRAVLARRVK